MTLAFNLINYAAVTLILFGIVFVIAEAFFTSGVLAFGGIVALIFGSVLLMNPGMMNFSLAWPLMVGIVVVMLLFFLVIVYMALRARRRPIVSGQEELIGSVGEIESIHDGLILMRLQGELWQVRCSVPLALKQKVVVIGREGLVLSVNVV
jgi:membrane-bound serine protease (ClpP class)